MSDKILIEYGYSTGFANCSSTEEYEIDADEWHGMTEEEQGVFLDDLATEYRNERCDCWAFVKED